MDLSTIETTGLGIDSTMRGFGPFASMASQYLEAEGIGKPGPDGLIVVDKQGWYPLQAYVTAYDRILREVGNQVLIDVGRSVVNNVQFPPTIRTVEQVLFSIDVAFHLNHRRGGKVMFDPATGQMLDGIGHFLATQENPRKIVLKVDTPYQCPFDMGVVTGMAQAFERKATVTHEPGSCRTRGGSYCIYSVTW